MNRKQWIVSKVDKDNTAMLAEKFNIDPFTALLMTSRNIVDDSDVIDFIDDDVNLIDPFDIIDMDKAVDRVNKAIFDFEKIAIVGDYDADGVTATAVMYSYLEAQGADVFYYLPNRIKDGYGLSNSIIDKLNEKGTKLIITVDNGISCINEVDYASSFGIDVVVTDHHSPGEKLPNAVAVVNPHREDCSCSFKDWAGVGVAYKLVSAIEGAPPETLLHHFADLIAIGTVADVVPLKGENRKLVKYGVKQIARRERCGIDALLNLYEGKNLTISSTTIAFYIAPRINAAGRMESAEIALNLLLSEEPEYACELANQVNNLNSLRKETEAEILKNAELKIAQQKLYNDRIIVVDGENWHEGVIGIVASRILNKYQKPCIVIASNGEVSKASGRSIDGLNLFEALTSVKDMLLVYGGHSLAAGFSIETNNIESFRNAINEFASKQEMPYSKLYIDCKLNPEFIDMNLLNSISYLEPFGEQNPSPIFGLFEMCIDSLTSVGDNNKHLKMTLHKVGKQKKIQVMKFETYQYDFPYKVGDIVDLAVGVRQNEFLGVTKANASFVDMRFSYTNDEIMVYDLGLWQKIIGREELSRDEKIYALPSRQEIGVVFKYIKNIGHWRFTLEILWRRINRQNINLCKVHVAVEALKEIKVLDIDENGNIIIPNNIVKSDLNKSSLLNWIQANI